VREIRTLRAMWRGLETTHGSDTEALSTETESKQSRPNLRSIGASPRPYRAPESDANPLSSRNSNQMHRATNPASVLGFVYSKNLTAFNTFNSGTVHSS
jgi:hypothetical protein